MNIIHSYATKYSIIFHLILLISDRLYRYNFLDRIMLTYLVLERTDVD